MGASARLKRLRFGAVSAAVAGLFAASAAMAAGSVIYSYDALGRLVLSMYDTGVCIGYAYDAVGNRLSETIVIPGTAATGIWDCATWDSSTWAP